MISFLLHVGLDVHKDSITVAIAEEGSEGEVRLYGKITNDLHAIERTLRKISKDTSRLRVVYEAGPCGFVIKRHLDKLKIACEVIAPSLIPGKPGDKIKTDRRDAIKLARLHRANELTKVYIPNQTDEIIRDLCRARTDAVRDLRASRFQLKAFLLRHGYRYSGKTSWTQAHLRYLRELSLSNPAQKVILEEYIAATDAAHERITRLEAHMSSFLQTWRLRSSVEALMAFRGFQTVAAMVLVSELGEISRFTHPRQLMCYLGLVSSEASSSNKRRQGAITKCGNGHARWILIECAQHYRLPPKVSKDLTKRQEGQSRNVKTLSWKAQNRLFKRYHALNKRGLPVNKTIVAVARELTGFVWALLKDIEPIEVS